MEKTTVEPPLTATSLQGPLKFVPADSSYIDSYQNLCTTAMAIPNCQNNLSATAIFFQQLMKNSRMVMKLIFDFASFTLLQ